MLPSDPSQYQARRRLNNRALKRQRNSLLVSLQEMSLLFEDS
jgi:hypothetical protein